MLKTIASTHQLREAINEASARFLDQTYKVDRRSMWRFPCATASSRAGQENLAREPFRAPVKARVAAHLASN
jgi:hypothetical protein